MASLLSPTATALSQDPKFICFSPSRALSQSFLWPLTNNFKRTSIRCNAILDGISDNFLKNPLPIEQSLSQFPGLQTGYEQFQSTTADWPEVQKWGIVVFLGFTWIYLTARPGVLIGAIDAYILAPLQVGLDTLTGRRSLKRTDFLIGERLGEGSFGVVYSGVIVPKNVKLDDIVSKRGRRKAPETDERLREKVILKKVKVGVQGAIECGDFEEWFNYRLSRAAPETCAEFLGSFIADKTNSQFIKGEKWLVWKFEVLKFAAEVILGDLEKRKMFKLVFCVMIISLISFYHYCGYSVVIFHVPCFSTTTSAFLFSGKNLLTVEWFHLFLSVWNGSFWVLSKGTRDSSTSYCY